MAPPNFLLNTDKKKAAVAVRYLAMLAVEKVYGSGKQCNTAGKEAIALAEYLRLAVFLNAKDQPFTDHDEDLFAGIDYNSLSGTVKQSKNVGAKGTTAVQTAFTAEQIWSKGMECRRDLPKSIIQYAK